MYTQSKTAAAKKASKEMIRRRRRSLTMEQRNALEAYMFLSPWLIGLLVFFLLSMSFSVYLSFNKVKDISKMLELQGMEWVGLENYTYIFTHDTEFVPALLGTLTNTLINMPLIVIFSLIIAILINRDIRARGFFRAVFFLPMLLGAGYIMRTLTAQGMAPGFVVPIHLFEYLGKDVAIIMGGFFDRVANLLWSSSVQIILFLAGLQGISKSLYESARVDSATEWEVFWKITLPMISPVILLNAIYTAIDSFTAYDNQVLQHMTDYFYGRGLREDDTGNTGGTTFDFGKGAAVGWVYFISIMVVIGLIFWALRSYVKRNVAYK